MQSAMKALPLSIAILLLFASSLWSAPAYSLVQGIDKFDGSLRAWHLLETNGFVVADPSYQQIFEPYLDASLPPFITTDSAWQTYEALLAGGIKQLGLRQIPWRCTTSGLEFLMAHPETRSVAAEKVLREISGNKAVDAIKNLNETLPADSLTGESLRVLATLQQPLPDQLAPAFHSEAWAAKQLWTQLAGAITQSHSRKATDEIPIGADDRSQDWSKKGVVAPYPDFFAGLARLSRETAGAMDKVGLDESFDARALAQRLLDGVFIQQGVAAVVPEETVKMARESAEFAQFFAQYSEAHPSQSDPAGSVAAAQRSLKDLETIARRCLNAGVPTEDDTKVLQSLFDQRLTSPRLLRDFADTCDKLAKLARDYRDGKALSDDDEKWMAAYGMLLAGYSIVPGQAANDLSTITALGTNAANNSILWAALGQPQALYIILPSEGRLQLYRGAVTTYREFTRPASDSSDDKWWQEQLQSGSVPAPPPFTGSFRAEKNALDILDTVNSQGPDSQDFQAIQQSMTALQLRVTDADLPALIDALAKCDIRWNGGVSAGITAAIAKLNWKPEEKKLLALLDADDGIHIGPVVSILLQHPEWLDAAFLTDNFEHGSSRTRRVFTLLLGHAAVTGRTRPILLQALADESPGVRWQAVLAIGDVSWDTAEKISPLLDRLSDSNEMVGAAAAATLGKIGATNVAQLLFTNLQKRLQSPRPSAAALEKQTEAVRENFPSVFSPQSNPFDPGNLLARVQMGRVRRFGWDARRDSFSIITALVETLGELKYEPATETIVGLVGSPNTIAAVNALKKLAPAELTKRLLAVADDKNALAQARDEALTLLSDAPGANASDLVPLLDDHTAIPGMRPMPGREWRICDRAAMTLAALLGRSVRLAPMMPVEERDQQIDQVKQWLKSAY
jgi:hypothetical protein